MHLHWYPLRLYSSRITKLVIFKDNHPSVSTFLNPHPWLKMKLLSLQSLSKTRFHPQWYYHSIIMIIQRKTPQKRKVHWQQFILMFYPLPCPQYQPRIYTLPLQIPLLYLLHRRYNYLIHLYLLHRYPPLRVTMRTSPKLLSKLYPHHL